MTIGIIRKTRDLSKKVIVRLDNGYKVKIVAEREDYIVTLLSEGKALAVNRMSEKDLPSYVQYANNKV